MTVVYTTKIEKELLDLCKTYIRVMDCTPSQLCEELYSSITQVYESEAYQVTEYFKKIEIIIPNP